MTARDDQLARQADAVQDAVTARLTDDGLANLVEKTVQAHAAVLDLSTRDALRSVVARLQRSGGGPL
jgi:hypothetical protein